MSVKKLLSLIVLISLLSINSQAEKKQPPIPMAELQNPKGPSYVPIPYPQTREEIIIDLKYAIKEIYLPEKGHRSYVNTGSSREILLKLLEEESGLHIGKIVPASNKTFLRAEKYYIMDILDPSGIVVARVGLEDSGLYAGAGFASVGFEMSPLKSIDDVKVFFAKSSIPRLANSEIESIEYERFGGKSPIDSYLKINVKNGLFYMDSREKIFEIKETRKFSSSQELMDFALKIFKTYSIHHIKKPFDRSLVNTLTYETVFLKAVE